MIVRRFMNWLRLTMAASLGRVRLRSREQHAREPMLVGASTQSTRPGMLEQASPGPSLSSWLDNGRRLRPRLRLTPTLREPGVSTTRPLRMKPQSQPMASQPAPASSEIPAPRISIAPVAAEPTDATPMVPVMHAADEQGDDLSDLERLDAETRRLMLLRHLVRRRIFNEGFASDDIPQQYHRSIGLEAPPPQE